MSLLTTLDNLVFSNLNLAKSGRVVKLICDKQPFNLKTNTMYLPFGVNKFKKQWSNFEEYSIDCYVDSSTTDNEKYNELNDKIFNLVKENTQLFNIPDVSTLSNSPFYRDNKSYPKLLKLQLPRDTNGNFTTQFFDDTGKIIIVDETNIEEILAKKVTIKTLITCSKVWVYQNKVGSIWNVLQIKLTPKTTQEENDASEDSSDISHTSSKSNKSNGSLYNQKLLIEDD
jgi:hypothetical protein